MANLSVFFLKHLSGRTLNWQFKSVFSSSFIHNRKISISSSALCQRKFGDKHEWVSLKGKIGTVGITNYAQESLGEVVFVQLPEINSQCQADDHVGVIESVKAVNELCSPVSGTITEVNTTLEDNPSLVNESCYDKGWIFKVELSDPSEMDKLMTEKEYEEYLKSME